MARKGRENDHSKYALWIDPNEVTPYERNAKKHDEKQVRNIANSIRRFGWQQDTVITSDKVLVIGHGRRLAALKLGCMMPYHMIDKKADELTDEDIRELRIADNATNAETGFDFELLGLDIEGLEFDGFDFDFGSGEDGLAEAPMPEITEDEPPEPPEEPKAKHGDIYQLGRHRLMCGDGTSADDVAKLMNGELADMVLTDPPYGTTNCEWDRVAVVDFWASIKPAINIRTPILVFSQQPYTTDLINSKRELFKYEIVWVKTQPTGFLNAHVAPLRAHELICVFCDGAPDYYPQKISIETKDIGRKKTNGTQAKQYNAYICGTYEWEETGERYTTDVVHFSNWNGARFGDTSKATLHPTQKPVELLAFLLRLYSTENKTILDCFGGSGSTLIACEQTGRNCYMMELDPHYVDVIIARWENLTGEKAVLISES